MSPSLTPGTVWQRSHLNGWQASITYEGNDVWSYRCVSLRDEAVARSGREVGASLGEMKVVADYGLHGEGACGCPGWIRFDAGPK